MEQPSAHSAQPATTAKKSVLVKRVKVPVKQPVSPSAAASAPIVKKVKILVKRPVSPAVPPVAPPVSTETPAEEKLAETIRKQPKPAIISGASSPSLRERRIPTPPDQETVKYVLPNDPLNKITAHKSARERFFLFYIYARLYVEEILDDNELPPLAFKLPQTKHDLKLFKKYLKYDAQEGMMDDIADDLMLILPLIPEMQRILGSDLPLDDLLEEELDYIEDLENPSVGDQMVTAYLLCLADMEIMLKTSEARRVREENEEYIEEIRNNENEERSLKKAFIDALKKEDFPVDAEKLINNYFNFSKKDAEKAYNILITNPLFYAPVQLEKMPKKFFGMIKAGSKEAKALNKKLASFLKKLKI